MTSDPIRFSGRFEPSQVHILRGPPMPPPPRKVQDAIDAAWRQARARLGERLFDGSMSRLNSWRLENGQLWLELSPTGYRHFLGTNFSHPEFADQYGPAVMADALGISALLETADGQFVMGIRGAGVAYHAHRVHPLGGTVEDGEADVFAAIRRELLEEAALPEADLSELYCTGLVVEPVIRQPELMFYARTRRPLAEVALDKAEHDSRWSIPAERAAVAAALMDERLTPIAAAALRLILPSCDSSA